MKVQWTSLVDGAQGHLDGGHYTRRIPGNPDWAIYIRAEAQEHAKTDFGSMSNYAAFVEAHVDIDRKSDGKRVYSSGLTSEVSNHTRGFEPAAKEAYKNISPKIIEILKKQLGL